MMWSKRTAYRAILASLCGLWLSTSPLAAEPNAEAIQQMRERLETQLAGATERGFSGTVLAHNGDEIVLHRAYGLADRDKGITNTTATLFDIGSISKQFTKAAILVLEESGRLATSDPISKHLPNVPADKSKITIEQVIDHQAGFREYHDTEGDFESMDRAEALRRILGQKLRFEPGTDQRYSNSGYTLLAAMVEAVTGERFQEFVRENQLRIHNRLAAWPTFLTARLLRSSNLNRT